jgi:hypothetical protein
MISKRTAEPTSERYRRRIEKRLGQMRLPYDQESIEFNAGRKEKRKPRRKKEEKEGEVTP